MPTPDANEALRTTDHVPSAGPPSTDVTADFAQGPPAVCGATAANFSDAAPDPMASEAERAAGSVSVPGYEIIGVLGRGGMGVVYKAHHLALKRTVALKMVLAGGHAGPSELNRFRIEAEAVARLQHPNIVQIHEVGAADGHPYCALEFVEGGNLAGKIVGHPLPAREAAQLMEALARAMQLAHSRNVVHRDLKPANILLAADGTPKITDFGLARQLDSDSGETQTGAVMGTPSYMAPEQAAGQAHEAGPAADVYALGAILYECLAGRPPFKGTSVMKTLDLVRNQEPAAPSQWQAKVPVDLETIALKCLRKEPENRYASAGELADELGRYLRGEPVHARPLGRVERAWRWCRRNPAVAALTAAVALSLVIGLAVAIALAFVASERAGLAEKNAEDARLARDEANEDKRKALASAAQAKQERETADRLRDVARNQLEVANNRVYVSDMRTAYRLAEQGKPLRLLQFLDQHKSDLQAWDSRGWEWYYLLGLADEAERVLTGHREFADLLAWSPQGRWLASASSDITVNTSSPQPVPLKIWDRETGRELNGM